MGYERTYIRVQQQITNVAKVKKGGGGEEQQEVVHLMLYTFHLQMRWGDLQEATFIYTQIKSFQ